MLYVRYTAEPMTRSGLKDFDQAKFTEAGGAKPDGVWFSVGDGADWRAYCEARAIRDGWGLEGLRYQTEIALCEHASILSIKDAKGIDELTAEYGKDRADGRQSIDWARIAERFDGVTIAPHCHERTNYNPTRWYGCWDVQSGCVWRARAVKDLRPLNYGQC